MRVSLSPAARYSGAGRMVQPPAHPAGQAGKRRHVFVCATGFLEEAPDARESFCNGYALSIAFSRTGKPLQDGFCHVVAYAGQ